MIVKLTLKQQQQLLFFIFIIRALTLHRTCGHQDHQYNHRHTHTNI